MVKQGTIEHKGMNSACKPTREHAVATASAMPSAATFREDRFQRSKAAY